MNADGSGKVKIIKANAYAPQVSDDGKTVYFVKKDQSGIWAYDLETKNERLIIKSFHPAHWGAFTLAESGIYYLNADNKRFEFFDFDSKRSGLIYQPQARIPRLGVALHLSPDRQRLMFSQIDRHDADIMLLEEQR